MKKYLILLFLLSVFTLADANNQKTDSIPKQEATEQIKEKGANNEKGNTKTDAGSKSRDEATVEQGEADNKTNSVEIEDKSFASKTEKHECKPECINPFVKEKQSSIDSLQRKLQAKEVEIKKQKVKIDSINNIIAPLQLELSRLQKENSKSINEEKDIKDCIEQKLKDLIRKASDYIYEPYDRVGVQNVGIPAYQATKGSALYEKHKIRLLLLQSYEADINELLQCFRKTEEKMSKPMAKLDDAKKLLTSMQSMEFYKHYAEYDDWTTWLGNKIYLLENYLKKYTHGRPDFSKEINELEQTLK